MPDICDISSNTRKRFRNSVETYYLLWLDATVNSKENIITQQKLRSVINQLHIFEDINQCREYIRYIDFEDRLFLIISGEFGQQLIPEIHQLEQVYSIYIYCLNKEFSQQWSEQYTKVMMRSFLSYLLAIVVGERHS